MMDDARLFTGALTQTQCGSVVKTLNEAAGCLPDHQHGRPDGVTPGYYRSGSTYNVVVGNGGVSGGFSAISGNGLTFISFVPVGVVTASVANQRRRACR